MFANKCEPLAHGSEVAKNWHFGRDDAVQGAAACTAAVSNAERTAGESIRARNQRSAARSDALRTAREPALAAAPARPAHRRARSRPWDGTRIVRFSKEDPIDRKRHWSKMSQQTRAAWIELGWNARNWDDGGSDPRLGGHVPWSEKYDWHELHPTARAAAERLGYDERLWRLDDDATYNPDAPWPFVIAAALLVVFYGIHALMTRAKWSGVGATREERERLRGRTARRRRGRTRRWARCRQARWTRAPIFTSTGSARCTSGSRTRRAAGSRGRPGRPPAARARATTRRARPGAARPGTRTTATSRKCCLRRRTSPTTRS